MEIKIREHGYVKLVDHMGSDQSIESAARTSYDPSSTRSSSDTRTLLRYLLRNFHTTPFEMGVVVFHIEAPLFVARQIFRHRMASYNELSGRYSVMPDDTFQYHPGEVNCQSFMNKQGRDGNVPAELESEWLNLVDVATKRAQEAYHMAIDGDISREQARICLPLSTYTNFVMKIDLHNLMHFLKLRMDSHAQLETREYANAMYEIAKSLFPISIGAFEDYRLNAKNLSALDSQLLKFTLQLVSEGAEESDIILLLTKKSTEIGMSKRELNEFISYISPFIPIQP